MLTNSVFMALIIVAGLSIAFALVSVLPPLVYRRFADARLRRLSRGRLVLTYDDGPGEQVLATLLALLAKHGVKASFFLVGFRAQRVPAMGDAIVQAGHDVGCHTHSHRHAWKLSPWRGVGEVSSGYRTMGRWLGTRAPFRPPFGKLTTWTWLALVRRGVPICWWTHDAGDTAPQLPDPDVIVRRVVSDGGGVVLMHCHDRSADRHEYVLDLTQRLIAAARAHDFSIMTMTDLLSERVAAKPSQNPSIAGAVRA